MSSIVLNGVTTPDSATPLALYTGSPTGPSIIVQATNANINMNGDVIANSVSGNAAGSLLVNIITYGLAF